MRFNVFHKPYKTMAIFDNITIRRGYVKGEYFEVYSANMQLRNDNKNVRLRKASDGKWNAIDINDLTIYILDANDKVSIDDWRDGDEVEIMDTILLNPN